MGLRKFAPHTGYEVCQLKVPRCRVHGVPMLLSNDHPGEELYCTEGDLTLELSERSNTPNNVLLDRVRSEVDGKSFIDNRCGTLCPCTPHMATIAILLCQHDACNRHVTCLFFHLCDRRFFIVRSMRAIHSSNANNSTYGMNVGTRIAGGTLGFAALLTLTGCLDAPTATPQSTDQQDADQQPADPQTEQDETSDESTDGPTPRLDGAQGTNPTQPGDGQWMMAGETFTFNLAFCAISAEDILLHGPGTEDGSGEPGYLDVDLVALDGVMYGEARIDLGVTEQFDSSEQFYVIRVGAEESSVLELQERSFQLDGDVFFADGGQLGAGTLSIDCRA